MKTKQEFYQWFGEATYSVDVGFAVVVVSGDISRLLDIVLVVVVEGECVVLFITGVSVVVVNWL